MFERIIEIIVYVIGELRHNKNITDVNVSQLKDLGYTNSEISTAFSWIVDRKEQENSIHLQESSNPASFRILHEAEEEIFTQDSWGLLVQYQSLGLLDTEQIEVILERAILSGMLKINSEQLKTIVAEMIFEQSKNSLESNRFMLRGNDTIN